MNTQDVLEPDHLDAIGDLDAISAALDQLAAEIDSASVVEGVAAYVDNSDGDYLSRYSPQQQMDILLGGHGLLKGDQGARTLTKSKEIFRDPLVVAQERAARERNAHKLRQRIKRQQLRRARQDVERSAKPLDSVRMSACLALLGNVTHVITDLTMQRYNRFRRTLGDVMVEDIAQDSVLAIAEAMARSNTDLVVYAQAVIWLKSAPQPFVTGDGPEGCGRLLGTIIRVIGTTIVKVYRESTIKTWTLTVGDEGKDVWLQRNTTVESLDKLVTIARATSTDVDTLLSKHKASNKAKNKSTPPGMREKRLFARQMIDCAIEARGLSWLATMLLDDEYRRTDGSFKWTANADAVWAGFGFPPMTTDNARLKADYARKAVRLAFAFLPEVVMAAYELINTPEAMWYLGATDAHQLVFVASKIRSDLRKVEHQDAIDGGPSLEMTMRLIEDPTYRAKSLACIISAEGEDIDSE